MRKMLGLLMMMLLVVCVSSCTNYIAPDEEPVIIVTLAPDSEQDEEIVSESISEEPIPAPAPEPEPESVKEIKQAIKQAVKEEKKEFVIDLEKLSKQSLFGFNSDKISEDNYAGLNVVADFLKETPNVSVKVEGHTDNIGTKEYNQRLSERRAEAIANYLIDKGVDNSRVTIKGYGFSKPIASNKTAEGRAKNRRTEMKFTIK